MQPKVVNWPLWVVVVGGRAADLYSMRAPSAELTPIETLLHEDATLLEQERISDRPGRAFDRVGAGRHGMEPRTTHKREDEKRFAARIADRLSQGKNRLEYGRLAIVAAPRLLGELRAAMPATVAQQVDFEIHKDLSHATIDQLSTELSTHLRPAC